MSKVVIGLFHDRDMAEDTVMELKDEGYEKEISLVVKDEQSDPGGMGDQNLMEGTVTGGVLGGIAGLLAGAGALLIPGIGPIVAAGPFAATLAGLVGGGLAGGLIDYGVPESRGEYYAERVRQGNVLITLESSDAHVDDAVSILRANGAKDVEVHG
ncbi:MAG: hypothetical protein GX887_02340 [Firmicutes bacterium]|nr:hypothetical protein [Bacillota bacterium]